MSGVQDGTMASPLHIWFVVSRKEIGNMEGAARQNIKKHCEP